MQDLADPEFNAPPPVGDELPAGTVLCQGQYTIVRYLNFGGFGVTYLAHDSLGRKVVIKECFPGAMCCRASGTVRLRSTSQGMDFDRVVELFEREARALAQLEHPNIVGVHQIFKDNGTAYMAMDFVEGPDLFDVLESQPELLEPKEIRRILHHLLEALSYVHRNDMLHRDISPDNILLAPGGMPVLIDFGAAREDAARTTRMLSRVHTVKDGYSPQEFYLMGSTQQKSSDLYALAATVHHLIVGRAPPNSNIRLAAVAQDERDPYQPLRGRVSGYDDAFLGAIDTCLALFAKDRLSTAEEWLDVIAGRKTSTAPSHMQVEEGEISDDLKLRISELVSETTNFIRAAQKDAPRDPEQTETPPDPLAAKREAERQYWAILNEDPDEIRAEIARVQATQTKRRFGSSQGFGSHASVLAGSDTEILLDPEADHGAPGERGSRWTGWLGGLFSLRKSPDSRPGGAMHPVKE
ncbi:serine/threonine-protein kinase [Cognatishimia sp. F0-27]|uniref:serine/threonine-protein kinase n=1 Tax=Cognatishimia sp. F0-27 TaxID=2816855 RepID=UPI001D0C2115|nr:serine/threonine-protein kinase [Cognatishimia sp. F0-27]MCC1493805.1 serine/threonine protein kinase [Cognatishimia sp. F0-27]